MTLAKGEKKKSGEREIFFEFNGQPRSVYIADKKAMEVSKHLTKCDVVIIITLIINCIFTYYNNY